MQKPDATVHSFDTNTGNDNNNGDGDDSLSPALTFYPAWSFKASATWLKWVKLTAHDIHHVLRAHEKYGETTTATTALTHHGHGHGHSRSRRCDAPLLLFYLNHPIQYVQVVGVVVAFDEYYEKFWLLTIDDSSGATLDVTCPKPEQTKASNAGDVRTTTTAAANQDADADADADLDLLLLHQTLPTLKIGTVIQAKGTLSTFRSCRQLSLLRLTVVRDTADEISLITSRTSFLTSTLSKPWTLSSSELQSLHSEAEGERTQETKRAQRRRQREAKKRQREERHAEIIARAYERDQGYRAKAADEATRAGKTLEAAQRQNHKSSPHTHTNPRAHGRAQATSRTTTTHQKR
ncbi:hypothetical protein RBB50_003387 [Rhinocladiella similis]